MPKLPPNLAPKKSLAVIGLKWLGPSKTQLTLSDKSTRIVTKLVTVGWDTKLGEAPIILIGEERFPNRVPLKENRAWNKADQLYLKKSRS
jgi:hypothetical protein